VGWLPHHAVAQLGRDHRRRVREAEREARHELPVLALGDAQVNVHCPPLGRRLDAPHVLESCLARPLRLARLLLLLPLHPCLLLLGLNPPRALLGCRSLRCGGRGFLHLLRSARRLAPHRLLGAHVADSGALAKLGQHRCHHRAHPRRLARLALGRAPPRLLLPRSRLLGSLGRLLSRSRLALRPPTCRSGRVSPTAAASAAASATAAAAHADLGWRWPLAAGGVQAQHEPLRRGGGAGALERARRILTALPCAVRAGVFALRRAVALCSGCRREDRQRGQKMAEAVAQLARLDGSGRGAVVRRLWAAA